MTLTQNNLQQPGYLNITQLEYNIQMLNSKLHDQDINDRLKQIQINQSISSQTERAIQVDNLQQTEILEKYETCSIDFIKKRAELTPERNLLYLTFLNKHNLLDDIDSLNLFLNLENQTKLDAIQLQRVENKQSYCSKSTNNVPTIISNTNSIVQKSGYMCDNNIQQLTTQLEQQLNDIVGNQIANNQSVLTTDIDIQQQIQLENVKNLIIQNQSNIPKRDFDQSVIYNRFQHQQKQNLQQLDQLMSQDENHDINYQNTYQPNDMSYSQLKLQQIKNQLLCINKKQELVKHQQEVYNQKCYDSILVNKLQHQRLELQKQNKQYLDDKLSNLKQSNNQQYQEKLQQKYNLIINKQQKLQQIQRLICNMQSSSIYVDASNIATSFYNSLIFNNSHYDMIQQFKQTEKQQLQSKQDTILILIQQNLVMKKYQIFLNGENIIKYLNNRKQLLLKKIVLQQQYYLVKSKQQELVLQKQLFLKKTFIQQKQLQYQHISKQLSKLQLIVHSLNYQRARQSMQHKINIKYQIIANIRQVYQLKQRSYIQLYLQHNKLLKCKQQKRKQLLKLLQHEFVQTLLSVKTDYIVHFNIIQIQKIKAVKEQITHKLLNQKLLRLLVLKKHKLCNKTRRYNTLLAYQLQIKRLLLLYIQKQYILKIQYKKTQKLALYQK